MCEVTTTELSLTVSQGTYLINFGISIHVFPGKTITNNSEEMGEVTATKLSLTISQGTYLINLGISLYVGPSKAITYY